MSREFTFYDYIDAEGGGGNVIRDWLNNTGRPAKAFFVMIIGQLEASPPPGTVASVWGGRYTRLMRDEWSGFIELRRTGSVQYRILGQVRNREVLLVACGIHKSQRYITDVSPATASNRVAQMINNPLKYRRPHEYD